jgi:uncharacterized membrane protein YgcG
VGRSLLLAAALVGVHAPAQSQEFLASDLHLVDRAEVLSESYESTLGERLAQLRRDRGIDLIIKTTADLGGKKADEYGWAIEAERQTVLPKVRRVVLILSLDPAERTFALVSTRPTLEDERTSGTPLLDTAKSELARLQQAVSPRVTPHLIVRDFEGALTSAVDAIEAEIAAQSPADTPSKASP